MKSAALVLSRPRALDRQLPRALSGFATLVLLLAGTLYVVSGSVGLVVGVLGFYMVVGSLYLLGAWGSTRWLARVCSGAALALEAGRLDEARASLDINLERAAASTPMYAIAIWLRARLALLDGELERARERLSTLLGWHWYMPGGVLQAHAPQVRATLMLVETLAGDLEQAQRWREGDRSRCEHAGRRSAAEADAHARTWLVADAAYLARADQLEQLLDFLAQRRELAATLPRRERQCLAVLEAWALFRLGCEQDGFRGPHGGDDPHEPLRREQVELHMVEFLGHAWPELREFMTSGMLERPRARALDERCSLTSLRLRESS